MKGTSLVVAVVCAALTILALGIGVWEFISGKNIEAANWVMAAGGLGIVVFSAVQLYREAVHSEERLLAARAKLRPAARLARRSCEQALIEADRKPWNQWAARWFVPIRVKLSGSGGLNPIDILEDRFRETVTLAAEAGAGDVRASEQGLDAFILAADIINDLEDYVAGGMDAEVYQALKSQAHEALEHLATAAKALEALAPKGPDEPEVPSSPHFAA